MWPALSNLKTSLLALSCLLLCACAARVRLSEGERLLQAGKYTEAIDAYEAVLRDVPGNADAKRGILNAQRAAVHYALGNAQRALNQNDLPEALRYALIARGLPLNLEEADLGTQVDEMVEQATRRAEQEVLRWTQRGQFVPAVQLADRVYVGSPGMASRKQWRDGVRAEAIEYYVQLAHDLEALSLYGSAALQLAMGKKVGADVRVVSVQALWEKFSAPLCFAEPHITITDVQGTLVSMQAVLKQSLHTAAERLRKHCGQGTRPWALSLRIENAIMRNTSLVSIVAQPLPGTQIKTTETYIEEVPYIAIEEVTTTEKRIENKERKDCSPKPGQPRGCRVWTEKVEVEVPVVTKVRVPKIKRITKTRALKGPFPKDKVVTYPQTHVERHIEAVLHVRVEADGKPFEKVYERRVHTEDNFHTPVAHRIMPIAANADDSTPMPALQKQFVVLLEADVEEALREAAAVWSASNVENARMRRLQGQLPKAEELYLSVLALGARPPLSLERFFENRYGLGLGDVMDILTSALGREKESSAGGSTVFPAPRSADATEVKPVAQGHDNMKSKAKQGFNTRPPPDVSPMTDDELKEFEDAAEDVSE